MSKDKNSKLPTFVGKRVFAFQLIIVLLFDFLEKRVFLRYKIKKQPDNFNKG